MCLTLIEGQNPASPLWNAGDSGGALTQRFGRSNGSYGDSHQSTCSTSSNTILPIVQELSGLLETFH